MLWWVHSPLSLLLKIDLNLFQSNWTNGHNMQLKLSSSTDHVKDTDASCHGNMPSDKPTGWWFQPTPLKNMSQWEGWHPIYEMENQKCSKPPTSQHLLRKAINSSNKVRFHCGLADQKIHWSISNPAIGSIVEFPQDGTFNCWPSLNVLLLNVTNLMAVILGSYPKLQGINHHQPINWCRIPYFSWENDDQFPVFDPSLRHDHCQPAISFSLWSPPRQLPARACLSKHVG